VQWEVAGFRWKRLLCADPMIIHSITHHMLQGVEDQPSSSLVITSMYLPVYHPSLAQAVRGWRLWSPGR
jgi:hypothetical protein